MDSARHTDVARTLGGLRSSIQGLSQDPEVRRRVHATFLLILSLAAGLGTAQALDSRARQQAHLEGPGTELLQTLLTRLNFSLSSPQAGKPGTKAHRSAWIDPDSRELWATHPVSGQWVCLGMGWNAVHALLTELRPTPTAPKREPPKRTPHDPRFWSF